MYHFYAHASEREDASWENVLYLVFTRTPEEIDRT